MRDRVGSAEGSVRPLGWWLKEADARIDGTFERALRRHGLDRRGWQVLNTVARGPSTRHGIAAALSRFGDDAEIAAVVADLLDGDLVGRGADDLLELTDRGVRAHRSAAQQVEGIRARVGDALGDDGHEQLIALLTRLVGAFPEAPSTNGS